MFLASYAATAFLFEQVIIENNVLFVRFKKNLGFLPSYGKFLLLNNISYQLASLKRSLTWKFTVILRIKIYTYLYIWVLSLSIVTTLLKSLKVVLTIRVTILYLVSVFKRIHIPKIPTRYLTCLLIMYENLNPVIWSIYTVSRISFNHPFIKSWVQYLKSLQKRLVSCLRWL